MPLLVNQTIISGRLTRDPEIRSTNSNKQVAHLNIAHNRRFKDSNGEQKESTTFCDVDAWGRQVDYIGNNLKKGDEVLIIGGLEEDRWESNGQNRSKLKIVARSVQGVAIAQGGSTRQTSYQDGGGNSDYNQQPAQESMSGGLSDEPPF